MELSYNCELSHHLFVSIELYRYYPEVFYSSYTNEYHFIYYHTFYLYSYLFNCFGTSTKQVSSSSLLCYNS